MLTNAAKLSPTEVSLLQQQGYEACLAPVPFPGPSLSTQRCDKHHPSGSFCFSIMVMEAESRSSQLKFIHRSGWWYIPVPQSIGQAHSRETLGLIPSTIGEKKITLLWLLDQIFEKKPFSNILETKTQYLVIMSLFSVSHVNPQLIFQMFWYKS